MSVTMGRLDRLLKRSALAVLLASPRASGYQTGDVITVDGGYHSF